MATRSGGAPRPPNMAEFLADPGRPVRGRSELAECAVAGCRFGVNGRGLCSKRHDKWARQGRPDLDSWIAEAMVITVGTAECRMPFCTSWVENTTKVFCKNHQYRWEDAGRPDLETFTIDCQLVGSGAIDLRGLSPAAHAGVSIRPAASPRRADPHRHTEVRGRGGASRQGRRCVVLVGPLRAGMAADVPLPGAG